jgi:CheY-like chemotaxis protein
MPAQPHNSKVNGPKRKLRVLVVDDEPSVCDVVSDTIRFADHQVVGVARDGVEAVQLARELQPDLVVMDVLMPRMNGLDAMRLILTSGAARHVLLMSGEYRSLGATKEDMIRQGALAFLEKPFSVDHLFAELDRVAAKLDGENGR